MSNLNNLSAGHLDRLVGQVFQGAPALDPNYRDARQYKDSAEVWFGDAKCVVHGEYSPVEPSCEGDFEVQACMVGGVDILSGLTGEQIDVLATQAYAQCRGRK